MNVFLLDLAIIGLLAIGLVVWIGEPFIRRLRSIDQSTTADEHVSLLLQKDTLYTAIRDLTFDFHTGKVEQADYTALRHTLESEAIQVLQTLDSTAWSAAMDAEIERQVQELRSVTSIRPAQLTASICPKCSLTLQGGGNFCPACGQAIQHS